MHDDEKDTEKRNFLLARDQKINHFIEFLKTF